METVAASLRLLADPTRLRILRLLGREELNAGELAVVLGLGQPAVSRQLGLLREAGLLEQRRSGRFVFLSLAPAARDETSAAGWALARVEAADDDSGDLARLDDVLRTRREREVENAPDGQRPFVPGRSWRAWARAVSWLIPEVRRAVDLGCGDGALTLEIARFARDVVGVDLRPGYLKRARARARRKSVGAVRFERRDMAATGLRKGSFDLAVLSQSLHHAGDPAAVLGEARRLLRAGGRVIVLDLLPHHEAWVAGELGHRHTGFAPAQVERWIGAAGFTGVRVERMPARAGDPFKVLIAVGIAPGGRP